MNNFLIVTLVLMGIGVIYWVLIGQRKYNKMMRGEE